VTESSGRFKILGSGLFVLQLIGCRVDSRSNATFYARRFWVPAAVVGYDVELEKQRLEFKMRQWEADEFEREEQRKV